LASLFGFKAQLRRWLSRLGSSTSLLSRWYGALFDGIPLVDTPFAFIGFGFDGIFFILFSSLENILLAGTSFSNWD
jgi:hypothetical protein